jgi:hypothetical protein
MSNHNGFAFLGRRCRYLDGSCERRSDATSRIALRTSPLYKTRFEAVVRDCHVKLPIDDRTLGVVLASHAFSDAPIPLRELVRYVGIALYWAMAVEMA